MYYVCVVHTYVLCVCIIYIYNIICLNKYILHIHNYIFSGAPRACVQVHVRVRVLCVCACLHVYRGPYLKRLRKKKAATTTTNKQTNKQTKHTNKQNKQTSKKQ